MRLLVCGGRHFGRVPSKTPYTEVNQQIIRATEDQRRLSAYLAELHGESKIDLLLHFNHRGAERLAAHWAALASVPTKSLAHSGTNAIAVNGKEAFIALLNMDRVDMALRFSDLDEIDYPGLSAALKNMPIPVQTLA